MTRLKRPRSRRSRPRRRGIAEHIGRELAEDATDRTQQQVLD